MEALGLREPKLDFKDELGGAWSPSVGGSSSGEWVFKVRTQRRAGGLRDREHYGTLVSQRTTENYCCLLDRLGRREGRRVIPSASV